MSKELLAVVVVLGMSGSIAGYAGTEGGNGGDPAAQDFVTSAQDGYKLLMQHSSEFGFIDMGKLQAAINTAKVSVLPIGGSFQDAVRTAENFPTTFEILVDGARWERIGEPVRKMALSLHEYLGLTGYEVNNYIITSQLFGLSNQQMEAPPTIQELDHSFDSLRSAYLKLIVQAEAMAPSSVFGEGKTLTEAECNSFVQNQVINPTPVNLSDKCNSFWDTEASLFSFEGKNSMGVSYNRVLRISQKKDFGITDYFVNLDGKIIERSGIYQDKGHFISRVVVLDQDGNGYQHDLDRSGSSLGAPYEDYSSIVLANGSLGSSIGADKHYDTDGELVYNETTFSAINLKDWHGFDVELYELFGMCPGNANSACTWGTTQVGLSGGMVYSYNYLGSPYATPDDYRTITYLSDTKGEYQQFGKYVASRREYEVYGEVHH